MELQGIEPKQGVSLQEIKGWTKIPYYMSPPAASSSWSEERQVPQPSQESWQAREAVASSTSSLWGELEREAGGERETKLVVALHRLQ